LARIKYDPGSATGFRRYVVTPRLTLTRQRNHASSNSPRSTTPQRPVVHTTPYPNILQLLKLLQSRSAPLAVLSNKPHALTVEIVTRLDMAFYFAVVRGSQREDDRKPDPRTALRIAEIFGTPPEDVYLIGDSRVDIQTARNAGMKSVAVTWGFQNRDDLEAAHPDFFVDDPLKIFF